MSDHLARLLAEDPAEGLAAVGRLTADRSVTAAELRRLAVALGSPVPLRATRAAAAEALARPFREAVAGAAKARALAGRGTL